VDILHDRLARARASGAVFARTVADLLGSDAVTEEHVSDALSLRKARELVMAQ